MRVWNEGSKLFIEVPPKGDKDRAPFFSELSDVLFAGWQNANTVVYDTNTFSLRATAAHVKRIVWATEKRGYDISEKARSLMREIELKYEDEREVERMIEEQKKARKTAISKLKNGCGWCGLLSFDGEKYVCGANGKPCVTDNEEIERLFEEWKQPKVYTRPTPFPNKECQYLEVLKDEKL